MNSSITIESVLLLAGILFILGMLGVIIRKNVIFMLLSVEVMLNSVGLVFVVAGSHWNQPDGQIMFIFILAMAAAEASVGLALILQVYRRHKSLNVDKLREMRG